MGYGIKAWEIVGYTYRAETLCPSCVVPAMVGPHAAEYGLTTETRLDTLARMGEIDRMDESSYDSDNFPKVVFASSVEDGERCDRCGEVLR